MSRRLRSAAAMAGRDEEALLVIEDTRVRESSRRKRSRNQLKTSTSSISNSKRKYRRKKVDPKPAVVICLDDDEGSSYEAKINHKNGLPCMDNLREELSCAICLEICYEPSTTLCGHSFCKKCLKCAADKCGMKCPKCRQVISNASSCTVSTVLWTTIQLLFPEEMELRKKATVDSTSKETV